MTFGQFIAVLRARWRLMLVIFVATVVLTVGVSAVLPKKYTAVASVVVDPKPDPVSAMLYAGLASPAFMATQVDIVQSERVALRVVRNLKLAENPQVRQQWQDDSNGEGSIEAWLAANFQREMDVKPSRESNVISVSYRAADPRFAAGLANAFVQAYIETALELRVDPAKQYNSFFDNRAKEARDAVERAQGKLSAFQREKGILATDERFDVENQRLNELSSQLVALQALSAESVSRQQQAQGAGGDKLQEVLSNPVIGALKADLSRAEARLQELSARYGDNHPQVIEAKASIAELRVRVDSETRKVTGGVGVTNTINRQREGEIRAALEAQRTKVAQMKVQRDESSVLIRDVENAQRAFDGVMLRLNQSNLESQTTQSNVSVLNTALPPNEPSSPRMVLNSFVAVFAGILLAAGTALVRELLDRRVRVLEEIPDALGLPVLGVLPRPPVRRLFGRSAPPSRQPLMRLPSSAGKGSV